MAIFEEVFDVMRPMPVFKPEMRKANRDGMKRQTRRVMKLQPECKGALEITAAGKLWYIFPHGDGETEHFVQCPYGKVGDYCYMREPLLRIGPDAFYKDDETTVINPITDDLLRWRWKKDVLTSIFMPKEAARSIYQYTNIRVERVQDISEADALAEGVDHIPSAPAALTHKTAYAGLWDKINAARGYGWDVNPWVWVLEYKPVEVQ